MAFNGKKARANGDAEAASLIHLLNQLIRIELAVLETYDGVTGVLDEAMSREQLGQFRRNHEQHIDELGACVQELGGRPATTVEAVAEPAAGDSSVFLCDPLIAIWSNEDEVVRAYEDALERPISHPRIRATLGRAVDDQRRHWAWLALRVDAQRTVGYLH